MILDDEGVPPLLFVQLLERQAFDPDAVARLRNIMSREGTDEATLIQRDVQAPIRWFREVYPELDVDQATLLGFAFAEQAQLTSFGPVEFSAGQRRLGSRDRGVAHLSAVDLDSSQSTVPSK